LIMFGYNLFSVYDDLCRLGLVESERRFSTWIGSAPQYLRDHRVAAGRARVHPRTATRLRRKLEALAQRLPLRLRREIKEIIDRLERDAAVAAMLAR
jgi:hypothetical protein